MYNSVILVDFERRAQAARLAGSKVAIDYRRGLVKVVLANDAEYFFQGDDGIALIEEAEKAFDGHIAPEDYILSMAYGW